MVAVGAAEAPPHPQPLVHFFGFSGAAAELLQGSRAINTVFQTLLLEMSVLNNSSLLQHILTYVGFGSYTFVAPVNKLFDAVYRNVCSVATAREHCLRQRVPHRAVTLWEAACSSPSCLQEACAHGFSLLGADKLFALGRYSSMTVLEVAHALGMPYRDDSLVAGAARSGDLTKLLLCLNQYGSFPWLTKACRMVVRAAAESSNAAVILQWLEQKGIFIDLKLYDTAATATRAHVLQYLRPDARPLYLKASEHANRPSHLSALQWLHVREAAIDIGHVHAAAALGNLEVLTWCAETTPELCTPQLLTEVLQTAAASNQLAVCKWLREHGADWPSQLHWYDVMWSPDTVVWAHSEGCTAADPRVYVVHIRQEHIFLSCHMYVCTYSYS
jgi:hypothetical protein